MNKRKIIFIIMLVAVLLTVIISILMIQNKQNSDKINQSKTKKGDLKIWIVGDDKDKFGDFMSKFKNSDSSLSGVSFYVESFPNYEEYINTLALSFVDGNTPDIFILNNGEKSIFLNKTVSIPSNILKSDDFRKNFKGIFGDELIGKTGSGEDISEFISGIPIGYETLGIFYKRGFFKTQDFVNWDTLNNAIEVLKKDHPENIPIGIGNGSTVYGVSDIITRFFVGDGIFDIMKLGENQNIGTAKKSLATYLLYGDKTLYNSYDNKYGELKSSGENNLDLFSKGDILGVIGFPRMIEQIDKKGFKSNLLLADPFPLFGTKEEKVLIDYNYFVVNKSSKNIDIAYSLLKYMSSDKGAREYLKIFPYYLPALNSLEAEKIEENISSGYNIKLGDFFLKNTEYTSFNKGNKAIYDKEIIPILDDQEKYPELFVDFTNSLVCRVKKFTNFENLGEDCYKK